jgi:hypothetical protein
VGDTRQAFDASTRHRDVLQMSSVVELKNRTHSVVERDLGSSPSVSPENRNKHLNLASRSPEWRPAAMRAPIGRGGTLNPQ